MHAIRSSARREAWYNSDRSSRNLNPFGRGRRGRAGSDEELAMSRSVDTVPSQAETDRRDRHNEEYPYPTRADTAPSQAVGSHTDIRNVDHHDHAHSQPRYSSGEDTARVVNPDANDVSPTDPKDTTREIDFAENQQPRTSEEKSHRGIRQRFSRNHGKQTENDEADDTGKPKSKWNRTKLTPWGQVKAVLFESWINILLLAVPVGFAVNYAHLNGIANFVINFIAIVPLAAMLGFATEELAKYTNETFGGLLNASFGNATELILGVIALNKGEIVIVQTSLIGSMLSNLLLVLGMCFFFGGITRVRQHFNITVAQTASSILALSIGGLIIPTAFVLFGNDTNGPQVDKNKAPASRGTSVILLLVYVAYLVFQLKTHIELYNEPSRKGERRKSHHKGKGEALLGMARMGARGAATGSSTAMNEKEVMPQPRKEDDKHADDDDDDDEEPTLSLIGSLVTLGAATVLIAFCSEFLVNGITPLSKHISQEFIGLILLPIVGNAAEHATAVTVACKDKMDLAIGVAVGSSMQIALLVLPLMVVIGWCGVGPEPMTLDFDGFQVTVLFIAVLLVNYLIQDGESHWLEGVLLQATYIIIALTAYFYPVAEGQSLAG